MVAPKTNPDCPSWLTKALFYDIVRKDYTTCKIIGFSVNSSSGKGENYASVLYRVSVRVENDTNGIAQRGFMVKVNYATGFGVEMARILNVFPKEIQMYQAILPAFEKYYAEVGEKLKIGPKCAMADSEPEQRIILEDLSLDGFRTADRLQGLDMKHVELILEKLAQFHAASAVYVEKVGDFDPIFKTGIVNEDLMQSGHTEQYVKMLQAFLKDIECYPILEKVFKNYDKIVGANTAQAVKVRKDGFNVLCHGDLWSNNVLFRYSEDDMTVQECMFVDYQMCFYSSPVLDLHYFFVTSLNKTDRMNGTDYMIQFYHKHLAKNLRKLGYKKRIPTLLDLQMDFLDSGAYGIFTMMSVLPVVRAPPSEDSSLDNLTDQSSDQPSKAMEMKRRVYANPIFIDALEELIPHFERKGYFEI